MYFKLTLPNTKNELKVVIRASRTPQQFLLHVCTAIHVCKQLGPETKESDDMMALEAAYCKLDATKGEYANAKQKVKNSKKKEETPAPESRKKAKEPQEQADAQAPDIIADASTLAADKKVHKEPSRRSRKQR